MNDTDPLEQLAELEVPPVPEQFDQRLHDRINRVVLTQQLADLLMRGLPQAVQHFAAALGELFAVSLVPQNDAIARRRRKQNARRQEPPEDADP